MLGDYADALCADRDMPDHITSVPFRVLREDRSAPETELLTAGLLPVMWEPYPMWGQEPMRGVILADGIVRFPIPGSEKQAQSFLGRHQAGETPKVATFYEKDHVSGGMNGTCHGCFQWHCQMKRCGRCKVAAYHSPECQKKHWKLHKLICTDLKKEKKEQKGQPLQHFGGSPGPS